MECAIFLSVIVTVYWTDQLKVVILDLGNYNYYVVRFDFRRLIHYYPDIWEFKF